MVNKISFVLFLSILSLSNVHGQDQQSTTTKGMTVTWHHAHDRIYFSMSAPTTGWLAIGFNTSTNLTDTYLVMGRMQDKKTEVVEHYVIKPGDYRPIDQLGGISQVADLKGSEINGKSIIHFSLPHQPSCSHQKILNQKTAYHLLVAFSLDDDFNHHSIMRTTTRIIL